MKKLVFLFSCCALMAACNSKSSTDENDRYYESTDRDSTDGAEMSAATRQSEVDTNRMDIGTDRSAGTTALPNADKGAKLVAQSDCTACHRNDQQLVGPAYEAVAQKYEVNEKTLDYLAEKIIKGGKGVWGEVPMTPHPNLSEEEAKAMAQYVMSLKK